MNKVLAVIRREFIERVRTRSFLIGTFLFPVLMGVFGYLPQALAKRDTGSKQIVLLDAANGSIGTTLADVLASDSMGAGETRRARFHVTRIIAGDRAQQLRDSVVSLIGLQEAPPGAPSGVLTLTDSAVATGRLTYFGSNVSSFRDMNAIERLVGPVLREQRLLNQHADSAIIAAASIKLDLVSTKVTDGRITGESGEQTFLLAYAINLLMYMVLLLYGIQVMSSVIEEKTNRIVEVLVSSMTPFQMLLGKVIGVGSVGLVQLSIWGGAAFFMTSVMGRTVTPEATAVDGAAVSVSFPAVSGDLVMVVLVFFLLGYFLYSALYAAIGAMCNTQQEAQQANTPVTLCIGIGMISVFALMNDPSSGMAKVFSFIPLFAPIVMPVRYALSPLPLGEVLASVAAMLAGIGVVVLIAGRIYRVGILSYGKKPSLAELWRWIRTA